jgi:hypothetical protein
MAQNPIFDDDQTARAVRELANQIDLLGNAIQSAADTIAKALRESNQPPRPSTFT